MRLETVAVSAGRGRIDTASPLGRSLGESGVAHVPGIDLSTTYGFRTSTAVAASMDALLGGDFETANPVYARLHNPTVAGFEAALAQLEAAPEAVAFATGMAAITAVLMAAARDAKGRAFPHVVAVRPVYGGTDHILTSSLIGSTVSWVEEHEVASAIGEDTGLVFLETPANPTLTMIDIRCVVDQVRRIEGRLGRPVAVAVDSTFATPVLQNPLSFGADFSVHSATKFLGGHGDAMGGVVATSESWARRLRQVRMITGGILHPLAGYLLHRGLQTLPIRMRGQQKNAEVLAGRLGAHPAVESVSFPGLNGSERENALLETQQRGPGSVLSFRVRGGVSSSQRVLESLKLITRAVSLGSVDTLIQAPALLTHRVVDPSDRVRSGVPEDLLRLSVGLESVEDLWDDLERALGEGRTTARSTRSDIHTPHRV